MVQGVCPLKVKISQLPGGFRLNRSDDAGARFTLGNNEKQQNTSKTTGKTPGKRDKNPFIRQATQNF